MDSRVATIASILMLKFYFRFKLMNLVHNQANKGSNIQILDKQFAVKKRIIFWRKEKSYLIAANAMWLPSRVNFSQISTKRIRLRGNLNNININHLTTSFYHINPNWQLLSMEKTRNWRYLSGFENTGLECQLNLTSRLSEGGVILSPLFKDARILFTGIRKVPEDVSKKSFDSICEFSNAKTEIITALDNLEKSNGKFRKLVSKFISKPELLHIASINIINRLNNSISKGYKEIPDKVWFEKSALELRLGTYNFFKARRVKILKRKKKISPLTVRNPRDKIIQEAIRIVLEKIYEDKLKFFSRYVFGREDKSSCHLALYDIRKYWSAIPWYIEFDIKQTFPKICRHKLINILQQDIADAGLESLINKMFNTNIITKSKIIPKKTFDMDLDNILAPLLSNIYFSELDRFMEQLMKEYNKGKASVINPDYAAYANLTKKEEVELSCKERTRLRSKKRREAFNIKLYTKLNDDSYVRVKYVRYADNFIVGVRGSKKIALEIKKKICFFIKSNLHLQVNHEKTRLVNSFYNTVKFLGMNIRNTLPEHMLYRNSREQENFKRKRVSILARIDVYKIRRYRQIRTDLHKILKDRLLQKDLRVNKDVLESLLGSYLISFKNSKTQRQMIRDFINRTISDLSFVKENKVIKEIISSLNSIRPLDDINFSTLYKKRELTKKYVLNFIFDNFKDSSYNFDSKFLHTNIQTIDYTKGIEMKNLYLSEKLGLSDEVKQELKKSWSFYSWFPKKANFITILKELASLQKNDKSSKVINRRSKVRIVNLRLNKIRKAFPPQIHADVKEIYAFLAEAGIISSKKMPKSRQQLLAVNDYNIILYYRTVAFALLLNYRCCDNLMKIKHIINYHLRFSLIRTLKNKYKMNFSRVQEVYGNSITHTSINGRKISFPTYDELSKYQKKFLRKKIEPLQAILKKILVST
uniref:putative reverse transcriptase protein n=1 Tax=Erythrolobus coxiae TaxID=362235 RepID=UPI001FCD1A4D|nr:putative reverse transcriptase protein [Erythrolobus coxiae]UNJ19008.1 putative reverse transcriptase protein [Erythrolobus coxiae]